MILQLIHPSYTRELSVAWLEMNTEVGNFVIQPGHAPMVVLLAHSKKIVFCLSTGKQESLHIEQGIAHITRQQATIIFH